MLGQVPQQRGSLPPQAASVRPFRRKKRSFENFEANILRYYHTLVQVDRDLQLCVLDGGQRVIPSHRFCRGLIV